MLGRTDSRGRLLLLLAFVVAISGGLMLRLAYWQVGQHDRLVAVAHENSATRDVRTPTRGTVYDRTGRIVLAQTIVLDKLVADPHDLTAGERVDVAGRLVDVLGLSGTTAAALRAAMATDAQYVVLATNLEAATSAKIRAGLGDGSLSGVALEPQPVRIYPQEGGAPHTTLAAQVLGFVNTDGHGQYGVEQRYDSVLAGKPQIVVIDPSLPDDQATQIVDPGQQGTDIRLTIDAGVQYSLEQEVFAAWLADKAKTVSGVVMDPKTGEILAEASYPSYDANLYQQVAAQDPSSFRDPVISEVYEPGSVFKMLTASAALQTGTTTLTTKINDYGVLSLGGGTAVADADKRAMGWMTFADIVAYSRNVGVTQAALKLGKNVAASSLTLYQTWRSYGIGQPTGVDMAGEEVGLVRDPTSDPWRQIDLANGSFGQGVAATPLQILRAYTAMANGGYLVQPHVVGPSDASMVPAASRQIIDPSLSTNLTWLMGHVVHTVPWYKKGTLVKGYVVGGKTGTAQIWDPSLNNGKGDWKPDKFNNSFYGYVGRNGPELMVGVVIFQGTPTHISQGSLPLPIESYELFRRIATDSMGDLGRPPLPQSPTWPPALAQTSPRG